MGIRASKTLERGQVGRRLPAPGQTAATEAARTIKTPKRFNDVSIATTMPEAYVGIGANLGAREENVRPGRRAPGADDRN